MNPLVTGELFRQEVLLSKAVMRFEIIKQQHKEIVGLLRESGLDFREECKAVEVSLSVLSAMVFAGLGRISAHNTDQLAENTKAVSELTRALLGNFGR